MFSLKQRRAALQAAGLPGQARGHVLVLWWRDARGALRRADEFRPAADGSALRAVALPHDFSPVAAMVTAQSAAASGAPPQGDALLRGAFGRKR